MSNNVGGGGGLLLPRSSSTAAAAAASQPQPQQQQQHKIRNSMRRSGPSTTTTRSGGVGGGGSSSGSSSVSSGTVIIYCIICGAICFYIGLMVGSATTQSLTITTTTIGGQPGVAQQKQQQQQQEEQMNRRIRELQEEYAAKLAKATSSSMKGIPAALFDPNNHDDDGGSNNDSGASSSKSKSSSSSSSSNSKKSSAATNRRFSKGISSYIVGGAMLDRDEFASKYDMGIPLDPTDNNDNNEVLILYNSLLSLPSTLSKDILNQITSTTTIVNDDNDNNSDNNNNKILPMPKLSNIEEATSNCDFLNVALTHHGGTRRQCTVLMGQYESFHIQKWMRLPNPESIDYKPGNKKLDPELPLRLVNRGAQSSGRKSLSIPSIDQTKEYWKRLTRYLNTLDSVLEQLRPIAQKVAKNNAIVVLVCNFGQSELLLNFICNARQRKLDLSAVLVFATDMETYDLMKNMEITVFFDEENYGPDSNMPKHAARQYADTTFMSMMMAKVFCVHMISMLGYDVLFQDVDVIWFRNPLEYFHNVKNDDNNDNNNTNNKTPIKKDVYFQDDGNHALFYAPYSANTGFYYSRSNTRTLYFWNSLLTSGDLIVSTRSHQIPLVALLAEHASMFGLTIHIFARTTNEFPGGHAYHRRRDYMKELLDDNNVNESVNPYIFHMSWTSNEKNKVKFFQQLNEWYVNEQCIEKKVEQILFNKGGGGINGSGNNNNENHHNEHNPATTNLHSKCCSATPIFKCHYRDKPSKYPCKDKPPIDKGRPSFW